jgi:uncharacterized protein YbjT (DUF2867 family)
MKALIIGSTGATGKELVKVLLQDPAYTKIIAFVRRPSGAIHPKLVEIQTDFENLDQISGHIKGDVWFSCLGTTLASAGSKEKQWHIDYDIPAQFAAIAKRNGVGSAVLLSAYGASPTSSVFYSMIKGKLEEHIDSLGFTQFVVFRPGLLVRKETDRLGERVAANILEFLYKVGILQRFRPMPTQVLSEKMAKASLILSPGKHIVDLNKIFAF